MLKSCHWSLMDSVGTVRSIISNLILLKVKLHEGQSDSERVKLHLPAELSHYISAVTAPLVIVYLGLSGMTWPKYRQGYAGVGN